MNIIELLERHPRAKPCQDHRFLEPKGIFIAVKGQTFDGHQLLKEVAKKAPVAIVVQNPESLRDIPDYMGEKIVVQNTRIAMDKLSHAYFGFPSEKLFCVGVTGTNGKTTATHLIEYALSQFGIGTGVIGTIDHHYKDKKWETQLTSPGSFEFYARLKDFVEMGAKALSVEVSSHALHQNRMRSCEFDVGVFTNLTRDHLDYHETMENYFRAKENFFTEVLMNSSKTNRFAIINYDDLYGKKIRIPKEIQKISYGSLGSKADLTYEILSQDFMSQKLNVYYQGKKYSSQIRMCGKFNVSNYLAALGVLLAKEIPLQDSVGVFSQFYGVKGRLEKVPNTKGVNVFVDYAHTPDALENVLTTLNDIKNAGATNTAQIITVFGCGGDRDRGKRPLMGEIASKMSDHIVITSDNPRTEDPMQILKDIETGCQIRKNYEIEPDRRKAIEKAIGLAKSGDAILIAGKGHETYQIIGKTKYKFDDVEVAREFFKE